MQGGETEGPGVSGPRSSMLRRVALPGLVTDPRHRQHPVLGGGGLRAVHLVQNNHLQELVTRRG